MPRGDKMSASLLAKPLTGRIVVWLKKTDHSPDKSGKLHEEIIHLNVVGSVLTLHYTNGLRPGELERPMCNRLSLLLRRARVRESNSVKGQGKRGSPNNPFFFLHFRLPHYLRLTPSRKCHSFVHQLLKSLLRSRQQCSR